MTIPDLENLDIDEMSIEEIDSLLPQLDGALEEIKRRKPIHEVVSEKFSECWKSIEDEVTTEFYKTLEEERNQFIFDQGFKMVLERSIGQDYTKEFFRVLKNCIKKKNFRSNTGFYRKVNIPEVNKVAEVAFAVYRLHLSEKRTESFVGKDWIKGKVSDLKREDNPVTQAVIKEFTEIGLLPS